MRMKIYQTLVNKHLGISQRYHRMHDNAGPVGRVLSWIYLLWLNFAYTFLFCRFLGEGIETPVYEEKRLKCGSSESEKRELPEDFAEKLRDYDVISFDIFDTLIYRPFSAPTDLFYLIGIELEYMDFARIRTEAEKDARLIKHEKEGTYEVTLEEIWKQLEKRTGIDAQKGMKTEMRLEKQFCYANPYMLEVYNCLKKLGKTTVYTSDMYLPQDVLLDILTSNGYGDDRLFLSCEINKNKASGELFRYVRENVGADLRYAHVGDNENSDVKKANKAQFTAYPAVNPNKESVVLRAYDMSPIIGGAYRGVVNNRIYNGLEGYSKNYEFGFIYGGLFVLGYCRFIHDYCEKNGMNKILFLSRDGKIIQDVYKLLYPDENTEYAYISRVAANKITAGFDKYDFIKKLVYHKVNRGYTFEKILKAMELKPLLDIPECGQKIDGADKLTSDNVTAFNAFLDENWDKVLEIYKPQREAAKAYFSGLIRDGDKLAAVDIGWAGTGAVAIRNMVKKEWHINADVIGIVAGTNTPHNAEPFMNEGYLITDKIVSYMFSSAANRDLWKKHNPSAGYNLYFELLTSSADPSLKGYYPGDEPGSVKLEFLEKEENPEGILEIQRGIRDFAEDYIGHFNKYPFMFNISGRDAYAPMLVAASHNEKYLKDIYKEFNLTMEVGV